MVLRDVLDDVARDEDDLAAGERRDGMVHLTQDRHVQIADVTRHEVGHDLALAVRQELVAAGEALQDQMHVIGPITRVDQVMARTDAGRRKSPSPEPTGPHPSTRHHIEASELKD
jgi:hypothetical protein